MSAWDDQVSWNAYLLLSARRVSSNSERSKPVLWDPQPGWTSRHDSEYISTFASAARRDVSVKAQSVAAGPICESEQAWIM